MARILGLDLGSYSVKGVVVETTARLPIVRAYGEVKRSPEGEKNDTLAEAVKALLADPQLHADQVVVALPGPGLATHQVTLPFSDPKRIEATLGFEVESQLPFDLSEAVFDYQVVSGKDGKSELLVGVVRKAELQALLDQLAAVNVDPRIVTHPAMAYQNLLLNAGAEPRRGAGRGRDPRSRPRAERDRDRPRGWPARVRAHLRRRRQGSLPRARDRVPDPGARGAPLEGAARRPRLARRPAPTLERAAGAFVRGLQPLLREIRPSLKSYTARTRRSVDRVFLVGGHREAARPRRAALARSRHSDQGARAPRGVDRRRDPERAAAVGGAGVLPSRCAARRRWRRPRGSTSGAASTRSRATTTTCARRRPGSRRSRRRCCSCSSSRASCATRCSPGARRQVDEVLCQTTQRVLGRCEKNYDLALNMLRGKESPVGRASPGSRR